MSEEANIMKSYMMGLVSLVAVFVLVSCRESATGLSYKAAHVIVNATRTRLGDTVRVSFVNRANQDLYVQPECHGIERRTGGAWQIPEALSGYTACNGFEPRFRVLPHDTLVVPFIVWPRATPTGVTSNEVTGQFRLVYTYTFDADRDDSDNFVGVSTAFTVQ